MGTRRFAATRPTTIAVALIGATILLAGCGGSSGSTTTTTQGSSAYDPNIRANIERAIQNKMRSRVTGVLEGTAIDDVKTECAASSNTEFSCFTTISTTIDGVCAQVTQEQAGTVSADGRYTWDIVGEGSDQFVSC